MRRTLGTGIMLQKYSLCPQCILQEVLSSWFQQHREIRTSPVVSRVLLHPLLSLSFYYISAVCLIRLQPLLFTYFHYILYFLYIFITSFVVSVTPYHHTGTLIASLLVWCALHIGEDAFNVLGLSASTCPKLSKQNINNSTYWRDTDLSARMIGLSDPCFWNVGSPSSK